MFEYFKLIRPLFIASEYWKLFGLFSLIILLATFEFCGVASLFPYIKVLSDPQIVINNPTLHTIYQFFDFQTTKVFLMAAGAGIFMMIFGKGLAAILNIYLQARFTARMKNRLSRQCISHYMRLPYTEAIEVNSSVLSKHLLIEVDNAISAVAQGLILATNLFTAIALVGLMIWVNPFLLLSVIVGLVVVIGLIYAFSKKKIGQIGTKIEACNRQMYQTSNEALGGIKDIKSYQVEAYFIEKFLRPLCENSFLSASFKAISGFPGIIMNVLAFGTLLLILLYLLFSSGNLLAILPIMGVIGISVQRLLPTANLMYTALSTIRKNWPGLGIVSQNIQAMKSNAKLVDFCLDRKTKPLAYQHKIELQAIKYRYPNTDDAALQGLNLVIQKGCSIGVVGSSGAGKSTLVDVLIGLLADYQGNIYCDGVQITPDSRSAFSRLFAYVPQQTFIIDATIKENIAFGVPYDEIDEAHLNEVVAIAQLEELVNELPEGLETRIGERGVRVSGGQRQRVGIARALYYNAEILILDEATNALDSVTEKEFNNSLRTLMKEKTLIIIGHRLSSVRVCEQLVVMSAGQIISTGSYDELIDSCAEFRTLYSMAEVGW